MKNQINVNHKPNYAHWKSTATTTTTTAKMQCNSSNSRRVMAAIKTATTGKRDTASLGALGLYDSNSLHFQPFENLLPVNNNTTWKNSILLLLLFYTHVNSAAVCRCCGRANAVHMYAAIKIAPAKLIWYTRYTHRDRELSMQCRETMSSNWIQNKTSRCTYA